MAWLVFITQANFKTPLWEKVSSLQSSEDPERWTSEFFNKESLKVRTKDAEAAENLWNISFGPGQREHYVQLLIIAALDGLQQLIYGGWEGVMMRRVGQPGSDIVRGTLVRPNLKDLISIQQLFL